MPVLPISVVIVNYNAGPLLRRCVESVRDEAVEVVVVDNGSSDGSLEGIAPLGTDLATARSVPNDNTTTAVTVIPVGRNIGFAAACNLGIQATRQPYLLFLNPDSVLAPGTLARLFEVLEAHPHAGMAGGLLLNPDGTEQGGGRRNLPTPGRAMVRAFGLARWAKGADFHLERLPLPSGPVEVEAISGACMLVHRSAMEAVGPWDEGYFLHCEDLDWCARFHRAGWAILFVPDAPLTHHKGACSRSRPVFVEWHKHRGMLRFYRKFFRERHSAPLMAGVTLAVWLRFAVVAGVHGVRRLTGRFHG